MTYAANQLPGSAADPAAGVPGAPNARRARQPSWRDPRLIGGLALIAVSMLAGSRLLAQAGHREPVWQITTDLIAGDVLAGEDLAVARVNLDGGAARAYLAARGEPPVGSVVTRDLDSGELLPAAAVAAEAEVDTVDVPIVFGSAALPERIRRGSRIDVWAVPTAHGANGTGGVMATARRVLNDVAVVVVGEDGTALAPQSTRSVVVRLPADLDLAAVLGRLADGSPLATLRNRR